MRAEIVLQYAPRVPDEDGNRGERIPDYKQEVEVRSITELSVMAYTELRRTQCNPAMEPAENVNFSLL